MNIIHVFQTQTSANIDSQYQYFLYVGSYMSSNYVLVKMVLFVCKSNSRICLVIICLVHTNLLNTLNVCVLTCGLIVQTCGLIVQPSKLSYSYAIMLHS